MKNVILSAAIAILMLTSGETPGPGQILAQATSPFGAPNPERWNKVYSNPAPYLNNEPNAFVAEVVIDLKPGKALDIGMGQGRNSVYLAGLGWEVTGFDISESGMAIAQQSARAAGVKITTIKASMEDFDFGDDQWDLIVGTYVGASWHKEAVTGLKPGGVLAVEAFLATDQAPNRGFRPNGLLQLFLDHGLRILRYEDAHGQPDWSEEPGRVVRLFAQKPDR